MRRHLLITLYINIPNKVGSCQRDSHWLNYGAITVLASIIIIIELNQTLYSMRKYYMQYT